MLCMYVEIELGIALNLVQPRNASLDQELLQRQWASFRRRLRCHDHVHYFASNAVLSLQAEVRYLTEDRRCSWHRTRRWHRRWRHWCWCTIGSMSRSWTSSDRDKLGPSHTAIFLPFSFMSICPRDIYSTCTGSL